MRLLPTALLCACLSCHAADDCSRPSAATIASIDALPATVRALLGRDERGLAGIADADERANMSDVAMGAPPLPMRRFRSASAGRDCYAVTVERGGIAHWFDTTVVRNERGTWRIAGTRKPYPEEVGQHREAR